MRPLPILTALVVAAFCVSAAATAQETKDPSDRSVFSFTLENDLPATTDRYYTNGFRFTWTSRLDAVPDRLRAAVRPALGDDGRFRWQAAFGQNMYTPTDITTKSPDPDDQPYAAWLYGSVGVIADVEHDAYRRTQTSALLSLGVVGPMALGEPVQDFVHDIIDSPDPQGWDHQLHNEPAALLLLQQRWIFGAPLDVAGLRVDAAPHTAVALGNVFTHAAAGLTLRFGEPPAADYGPPRIQPASPGSTYFGGLEGDDPFGWYVFAAVEGRAVGRNIFLDGNTFRESRSVGSNPFVGDLSAGLVVTVGDLRVAYVHALRTQEFNGQSGPSVFGGVTVGYRF
jgi:hypothetical protein